jgi:hypothetical protein
LYRQANHYTHLAGSIDVGCPERLDLHELHAKVWPIAARTLDRARRELIDRAVSSPTTVNSVPAVLSACRQGRVAALFVRPDRLTWGRLDSAEVHPERRRGDIELATAAICAALQRGASIRVAGKHELPGDPPVAALLRY